MRTRLDQAANPCEIRGSIADSLTRINEEWPSPWYTESSDRPRIKGKTSMLARSVQSLLERQALFYTPRKEDRRKWDVDMGASRRATRGSMISYSYCLVCDYKHL